MDWKMASISTMLLSIFKMGFMVSGNQMVFGESFDFQICHSQ